MKKPILVTILPMLFMAFYACEPMDKNNTGNNTGDTAAVNMGNDTAVVLHERVTREKDEYRLETQREIDSTQNYIDRMDKQMEKAGAKAKQEWQQTKARLQPRLERARTDLNEFGNKADNEWDAFRARVKSNLDSLRADWRRTDVDVNVDVKNK